MIEINGINVPFKPIGGLSKPTKTPFELPQGVSEFQKVFSEELSKLKMSGQAQTAIQTGGIEISEIDMIKLESAVIRAESQKAVESLIVIDEKAYVVDVPNKAIRNVSDINALKNGIITGIDSAVFA